MNSKLDLEVFYAPSLFHDVVQAHEITLILPKPNTNHHGIALT